MDKRYWIGFNLVRGIGAVRLKGLIDHFGDLEKAWNAPLESFRQAGIGPKLIERINQVRQGTDLDKIVTQVEAQGIKILTWADDEYPARLKEIDQPPPVLYVRGAITAQDNRAVAVVGTRRVSAYGRHVCSDLAVFLAQNGVTVISGLARGVDAIAHQSSLDAGGRTIAVLGSGVDRIYPPEHRALAERIGQHGAVISDYALGTPPEAVNFPPRNRIISGLALATVVIEAGETSGALITAQFALDQGREVFAVPGSVVAPQSKGTNYLIAQGAHPLLAPRDILDVLDIASRQGGLPAESAVSLSAIEEQLLQALTQEPSHLDEIRARVELPIDQVSSTLVMMELKGLVRQVGGNNYISARRMHQ